MFCEIWKKFCFKFPNKQSCKEKVWATPAKSGIWQNRDWSLVAISPFYRFLYRGGVILSQIFPQGGPTTAYDLGPTPKSSSKAYQSVFLSTAVLCSFTSANPSWCWEGQKPHWSFNYRWPQIHHRAFKYIAGPSNTLQGLQIQCRAFEYSTGPPNTSMGLQIHHRAFKHSAGPNRFRIYITIMLSIPLAPFDGFQILVVWFKKKLW